MERRQEKTSLPPYLLYKLWEAVLWATGRMRRRKPGAGTLLHGTRRRPVQVGRYRIWGRVPPNVPCPCGKLRPNGLRMKWKHCHGKKHPGYMF